jgi:DNA primase
MVDTMKTIDLLSLIEQRAPVRFKRTASTGGGEYAGNCPWCGGTDRFHVWPHSLKSKPHYWCRGCSAKGDAISFLMEWEHLDFRAACQELDIDMDDLSYKGTDSPLLTLSPFPSKEWQAAANDFIYQAKKALLYSASGRPYLDYLLARGITLETIEKKNIGYVPLRDGKWIETPFTRWGLTEEMVTADQWAKGCVRVPDGLLFPYYGEDNKPWKLSMYRPLAELLPQFKRGLIMGSKECLLNEHLMQDHRKPIVMTESFLDAISIEQEAGDLVIATSTDGTDGCRSLRCQAKLQYAPFVLQSFDNDKAGANGSIWWCNTIKNCVDWPLKKYKDANEMLQAGQNMLREWIQEGLEYTTHQPTPAPVFIEEAEAPVDVCFLCKGELDSYTDNGTPCCDKHFEARQAVEIAMHRLADKIIEKAPSSDPLTIYAQTVDHIAGIFAPCEIHRNPPSYSLQDHVAFLNDKKRREEIMYEINQRRLQADRRYKHLHPEETVS